MGTKPPAAVGERVSKDRRQDLGAAARLSTRAFFPEQGNAGGPVQSSPELVEHIGSRSTRSAEQLSPRIACPAVAAPRESSCLLARLSPWRDVTAESPALGLLHADPFLCHLLHYLVQLQLIEMALHIFPVLSLCISRKFCLSFQTTFGGSPPV